MINYRATLPVPHETVARVSGWLQAHRRAHDVRRWQPVASCWQQAILVLPSSNRTHGHHHWLVGSAQRAHPCSVEGLGQAYGLAAGLAEVGVVQQPVDGGGGQRLRHQFVEP